MAIRARAGAAALLALGLAGGLPVGGGAAAGGAAWVDPTRPPTGQVASPENQTRGAGADPELQSILIGGGRRLALIGGKAYRVGERLDGLTVQNIFRDRVVLQGEGGTRTLRLTLSSGMSKVPSP